MASQSSENFDKYINKVAFRVELVEDDNGRETLRWTANEAGRKVVFYDEPYAGFWQKTIAQLMRIIPADFML